MPAIVRLRQPAILATLLLSGPVQALDSLVVQSLDETSYIEVDLHTGAREFKALEHYPELISMTPVVRIGEGQLLLVGFDAGFRRGLWAYDMAADRLQGVSGYVDPQSTEFRGAGPMFGRGVFDAVAGPGSQIYLLCDPPGPPDGTRQIIAVDSATGDRSLITSTGAEGVGDGPSFDAPVEMRLEAGGRSILLLDRFTGFYRVDLASGDRTLAIPPERFFLPPTEFELLPDGRIVCLNPDPDTDAILVYEPGRGEQRLLSGSFGGNFAGSGPDFGFVYSLAVDNTGRLYALDVELGALFQIDRDTGDRRIIAGGSDDVGGGEPLPGPLEMPHLTTGFRRPPTGWAAH
jgi:hypothetical protein